MERRWGSVQAAGALLLFLLPAIALAQTGQTAQIPLQFDFLNPGARSLGLGSAFSAVADDATAAFTNPAGLTLIVRKEASAELRYRRLDTPYLAGGRLRGTVTHHEVDTISGPSYGISSDSQWRPYFLSFVYPVGRWSIAGYRHELALQANSFLSQGAFQQLLVGSTIIDNARQSGLSGERHITVVNYAGAAGYRASDHLSLGVGLSVYQFDIHSEFASLGFESQPFGKVDLSTAGLSSTTSQSGADTQVAVNAGALITLNRKVRIGVVLRHGATFQFEQVNVVPNEPTVTKTGRFRTPTVIGAGVRLQPAKAWSFAFDFDHVQYSRLTDDFIAFQVDPAHLDRIGIPDGNELHFAAEYTLTGLPHTPSIRAGTWYDPSHSVHYASDNLYSDEDIRLRSIFPPGRGLWHAAFGAGLPISKDWEANAGADFTKGRKYVSMSLVARFGK